jgi:nucleoid DNA-binding protein
MAKVPVAKAANSKSPIRAAAKPAASLAESAKKSPPASGAKKPVMALVSVPSGPSALPTGPVPAAQKTTRQNPAVVTALAGAPANALKIKDLVEKVALATGAKKPQIREILEAGLAVMGNALSGGAMLNLPPFGKAKVSRAAETGSGKPMTIKLHRSPAADQKTRGAKAKQSLADDQD